MYYNEATFIFQPWTSKEFSGLGSKKGALFVAYFWPSFFLVVAELPCHTTQTIGSFVTPTNDLSPNDSFFFFLIHISTFFPGLITSLWD